MYNTVIKAIAKAIISATMFFISACGFFKGVDLASNYYTMDCVVLEVNGEEVVLVDPTDNEWIVYADSFNVGDAVKAEFFTNYTDNTRLDDAIKNLSKTLDK